MTQPNAVYLIEDSAGALLYIGCTSDLKRRLAHHRNVAPWWPQSHMVRHKLYPSREYALALEARAIRRYNPPFNVMERAGGAKYKRTKAGMAAARAAGSKFGRRPMIWANGDGSKARMKYLQRLDDAGELREFRKGAWVLIPKAKDLMGELNKPSRMGKGDHTIGNPETVRRWQREGFPGLQNKEQG